MHVLLTEEDQYSSLRSTSQNKYISRCREKVSLAFLKVHKTGSSTMANIIQRFGLRRRLNFALPRKKPGELRYNYFGGIGGSLKKEEILPLRTNASYDLLYNHVIFNKELFQNAFGNHTMYVTILREPFSQFTSALLYFLNEKLYETATSNLTRYLENPEKFEPTNRYLSFTDNRQALDLGVPVHKVRHRRFIHNYIKMLNSTFHLVMITEFFDESLILLKRLMCWSFYDILYFRKNGAYRKFKFNVTDSDIVLYRNWAMADDLIYNHFYHRFMDSVSLYPDFYEEVVYFKRVLRKTQTFCYNTARASQMSFKSSKWSPSFTVTSLDCFYMKCSELRLHNMLYHHTKG